MSFDENVNAGNKIITAALQSPNYAMGSSGWTINRDGSAEFQNVLVRGTITASTIIGSTIIGGTITAGIFKSANFDNTAHTGFEINATALADATATPPVPANTIQIYNTFQVGPTTGSNLQLAYNGVGSVLRFSNNNPADGGTFGGLGSDTLVVNGKTISRIDLSTAAENGAVALEMWPSGGTASGDVPAQVSFLTGSETAPPGFNGVKAQVSLGNVAADTWELFINNENSVVSSGTTFGNPALIIGDVFTPRSRLFVSPTELLSVDGSNNIETLFLNQNNTGTLAGGITNVNMRHLFARDVATYSFAPGTTGTFAHPVASTAVINFVLPASGVVSVHYKSEITVNGASGVLFGDVVIFNITQSTTPYGGSQNNCWIASSASATNITVANMCTFGAGGQGGVLGNPGDSMQVICAFQTSAATTWSVTRQQLSVLPSL